MADQLTEEQIAGKYFYLLIRQSNDCNQDWGIRKLIRISYMNHTARVVSL